MAVDTFTEYSAVQDYLFGLKARGLKFGIDRMRSWIDALGRPESKVPCIHITGTNGKGSTAAMLEAILRAAGWKTGLYTSPHLVRLGERVQVDRRNLSEEEIIEFTNQLRPVAENVSALHPDDHPSFFEFMTAMAFLQFARNHCDISLIEVGMGGRLDATNVVVPEISVITSVSLDHCEILGDSIEKIAAEKAGIIKPGRPVVLGHVPPEAEAVIRNVAREQRAPVYTIGEALGDDLSRYPTTNLEGDYQRWNAATAALTARLLSPRWRLNGAIVCEGLAQVDWPGRWQRVTLGGRPLILDSSHNPEGASVLEVNLRQLSAQINGAPIVITGVLGASRAGPLLETICHYAKEVHLLVPNQSRACSHDELRSFIPLEFQGKVFARTLDEIFPRANFCSVGGPDDMIVVTGSIYLLGEVLERIQPERGAGEGRLQDF